MSFVSAKPLSQYPAWIKLFFWKQRRKYGRVLDPGLLWGRSPKVFASVALLFGALDRSSSPLPPALRALVTVRVSQINHCTFCVDINASTLEKRGVATEKILQIHQWRESSLFSDDEKLALEYAEAMTRTEPGVSDALRAKLRARWDEDTIVELTGLIAFQNLSSKFNAALDVEPQGFCMRPPPGVVTPASA
jgi:AhpD family alkylhydroperoxidase